MCYKFKPLDNGHFYVMLFGIIFVICPMEIISIFCIQEFDLGVFLVSLSIAIVFVLTCILFRVFYPYRYEINNEYLIKYRFKKIILKIKIQDLKKIYVKKQNNIFKIFLCFIEIYDCSISSSSGVSFIFDEYEIYTEKNKKKLDNTTLKSSSDDSLEYIEIMSNKKIKKLMKLPFLKDKIEEIDYKKL